MGWREFLAAMLALGALAGSGTVARAQQQYPAGLADAYALPADVRPWTRAEAARADERALAAFARREGGEYAAEQAIWREVLQLTELTWGPRHPVTALVVTHVGQDLLWEGRATDAEVFLRRSLTMFETRLGADHPLTLTALSNLGAVLHGLGRYGEAENLLRRALAGLETNAGPDHPDTLFAMSNLAASLGEQGRNAEAEALDRRALAAREARLGPDHPDTLTSLSNLAAGIRSQGRYVEAEALHRRALAAYQARFGAEHPDTLFALNNVATDLSDQARYAESEPLYRQVLAGREARLGPDHSDTLNALNNLASDLREQGRYTEAEAFDRRALTGRESRLGAGHPDTLASLNNLGRDLHGQGRYADAEAMDRRTLAQFESLLGADHPNTLTSLNNLGMDLEHQGRFSEAEPVYRRAMSGLEAALGADHPETLLVRNNVAVALYELGRYAESEALLAQIVATFRRLFGDEHPQLAMFQTSLAKSRLGKGDAAGALEAARTGLIMRRSLLDHAGAGVNADTRSALVGLAAVSSVVAAHAAWMLASQNPRDARPLMAEAFDAVQTVRASVSGEALVQTAARRVAEDAGAGAAVQAWRDAQDRVAAIDERILDAARAGAVGDARRAALAEERLTAAGAMHRAENVLTTQFPRYFDLVRQRPVSVADLQGANGLLRADEALILFVQGEDLMPSGRRNGLVFVVTRELATWAEIPIEGAELWREVAAVHAMLADPGAGQTLAPGGARPANIFDRARAYALYQKLFGAPEIVAALAGKSHYLLAPQSALASLPFAALPVTAPAGDDADPTALRATQWLGLTKTLTVVPSVSALSTQRRYVQPRAPDRRTPFFGLGDPAFSGVADDEARGGRRSAPLQAARAYFRGVTVVPAALATLPRLPATAQEIRLLAQNLGAAPDSYVLQLDATEAELRRRSASGALARAEIVAFATHGLIAGEFRDTLAEPALALTPPPGASASTDDDGLLTASEAATLRLTARLVILSACNTAAADSPGAEALSGLARSFLYAGARSLLVSHYPVFDVAGMRLTTEAIRVARSESVTNPDAMRRSMEALMQDASADASGGSFAHPAQWAVYAVIDAN